MMTLGQHRIRIGKGIRNFPEKKKSNGENGEDSCKKSKVPIKNLTWIRKLFLIGK